MHSFRELPTAIMKKTENISEFPTSTNGFFPVYHFNDNFKRRQSLKMCTMTWKSELQSREQFQAGSSGRVSQFLSDKKHKQHTNVENELKCTIKTSLLSQVVTPKTSLKLAVDVYFPTVITAASCDYGNTNQKQTLLMI